MATYVPNALQFSEPTEARTVESAALEFRTLKLAVSDYTTYVTDLVNSALDPSGTLPGAIAVFKLSGDGVQSTFSTPYTLTSVNIVDVYLAGIYQQKDTYSVSGYNITFSEPVPVGTNNVELVITAVRSSSVDATNAAASAIAAEVSATNSAASALASSTSASASAASAIYAADASRLTIGTVTTVTPVEPAAAIITGLAGAQTLSLNIPQGIQGVQGPAGANGVDGVDGIVASVTGTAPIAVAGTAANPVVSITAGTLATLTGTETLTNKRITARVTSEVSSATPTINTDNTDIHKVTALAVNITSMTTGLTGTPTDNQVLIIEITGTAARTITWGTSFEASTVALPTTTVATAMLAVAFLWNTATSKWRCVGVV